MYGGSRMCGEMNTGAGYYCSPLVDYLIPYISYSVAFA